ncbi:MAG TPA: hypothetical protein VLQ68_04160, partial [Rhizobiaceae bacterium]|nr:hypothetical protein [Rhizobiaceae bacterium]
GAHYGDWEQVMVTLTEDQNAVAAVTFYQHAGWYTRIAGPRDAPCTVVGRCEGFSGFRRNGERPVVYVGKVAHGSFHYDKSSGLGNVTGAKCLYFEDYRNPAGDADYFPTHTSALVDLGTDKEGWNAAIGDQQFMWGPGPETGRYDSAISTNPRLDPPVDNLRACKGSALSSLEKTAGCYQSECLAGDDQPVGQCLKECKPGYTNTGLTCYKFPFGSYGRLGGGNPYNLDYTIPTVDVGLSRRRYKDLGEWTIPSY